MKNYRWIPVIAAIVFAAVIGFFSYQAGVAAGLEQTGKIAADWHRPWGFGFAPFFIPFFFILFWMVILRGLFWRGGGYWHRGRCGAPDGETRTP